VQLDDCCPLTRLPSCLPLNRISLDLVENLHCIIRKTLARIGLPLHHCILFCLLTEEGPVESGALIPPTFVVGRQPWKGRKSSPEWLLTELLSLNEMSLAFRGTLLL
jgi:hypothetical protein